MRRILGGLTVAAAIAGCGGGGGLSKDEYVSKADAICSDANKALEKMAKDATGLQNASSQEEALAGARDLFADAKKEAQPYYDKLADLEPPSEIEDDANRYVDSVKRSIDVIDEASKVKTVEELNTVGAKIDRITGEQDKLARKLGFKDCGDS